MTPALAPASAVFLKPKLPLWGSFGFSAFSLQFSAFILMLLCHGYLARRHSQDSATPPRT